MGSTFKILLAIKMYIFTVRVAWTQPTWIKQDGNSLKKTIQSQRVRVFKWVWRPIKALWSFVSEAVQSSGVARSTRPQAHAARMWFFITAFLFCIQRRLCTSEYFNFLFFFARSYWLNAPCYLVINAIKFDFMSHVSHGESNYTKRRK